MAVVTPLIDTLLATRLAQRLDLLTLKGQTEVGQARPALPIDEASNETRLPSRAALTELARSPAGAAHAGSATAAAGNGGAPASAGVAAETALSEAVRAIGTVLRDAGGRTAPAVRGTAPIWTSQLPPSTPLLAKALAGAVSTSGVFYESHLKQFAGGTRTLSDLRTEPQALLTRPPPAAAHVAAAYGAREARVSQLASGAAGAPDLGAATAVTAIHPDAVLLVHQQLDLLELAMFRWSGEAWPGTRMEWEIKQESEQRKPTAEEPMERTWSTTLQLSLPVLGAIEVRLSLGTAGVQAQVLAQTGRATDSLNAGGDSLAQRLSSAGVPLVGYNVIGRARAPADVE
jgi:hypothetical protein